MRSAFSSYSAYRLHPVYKAMRACVMRRFNGRCASCGEPASEVHHINYPKPWGTFDVPLNMRPICHACHCTEHDKRD